MTKDDEEFIEEVADFVGDVAVALNDFIRGSYSSKDLKSRWSNLTKKAFEVFGKFDD